MQLRFISLPYSYTIIIHCHLFCIHLHLAGTAPRLYCIYWHSRGKKSSNYVASGSKSAVSTGGRMLNPMLSFFLNNSPHPFSIKQSSSSLYLSIISDLWYISLPLQSHPNFTVISPDYTSLFLSLFDHKHFIPLVFLLPCLFPIILLSSDRNRRLLFKWSL